ncbi:MAG: alpha-N-acetylgalactosaminidase [Flavobacteriaceae bacterium]|nr:alpha-N-acetylgalactosaminidase [Flavobacteriaceae bacterium]
MKRRDFISKSSIGTAAVIAGSSLTACVTGGTRLATQQYMGDFQAEPLSTIRAAFIGVGARGGYHAKSFARLKGTEVVAICDVYQDLVEEKKNWVEEVDEFQQHQNIALYYGDEQQWLKMLEEIKPDIVFIATNWENHAPMAIASMKAGAHAFVEVPMATTLKDLWDIVDTSEQTQKHCMMMENVNYGRVELMYLNMVRQGLVGDLLHAEAAYIHELRWQMQEQERGTGSWRTHHYANRNGNLYPTHGLGPVAQYMSLARGEDNFASLVSFSTPAMGRALYAKENYPSDHKWNQLDYKGGDLNTSIVKTKLGRTIMIQWDETSPRPYSRHNLIQGTKGTLAGFPTRIALDGGVEGLTKNHHSWVQGEELRAIYEKYDHPLYKRLNKSTKNSGHGGMDGIMIYRIVECLQNGLALDQNVYEGCLWSAVSPLSEISVLNGGAPQTFPDFTRGDSVQTNPISIIS